MNAVTQTSSHPASGMATLRSARAVGWAGLLVWLWATVVLPALHAAQHARELSGAAHPATPASHRARIEALVDEVVWHATPESPDPASRPAQREHGHSHGSSPSSPGPHGKGALEHLAAVFAPVPIFVVPPLVRAVECAPAVPLRSASFRAPRWLPSQPRGPPSLAAI